MNSARNIISKCCIKDVANMNKIEKETVEEIKDTIEMLEKVLVNGFLSDEEKETIRKKQLKLLYVFSTLVNLRI